MLLVSGATSTVSRLAHEDGLGVLMTPRGGHSAEWLRSTGLTWAADNDAFSGFNVTAFRAMLSRLQSESARCRFVSVPDVVGDAVATVSLFHCWEMEVKRYGYPVALVAQNGLENMLIPWRRFDALFIGGTDNWRRTPALPWLIAEAKQRGKWVHFGRINIGSVRIAQYYGADSFDGSGFSRQPSRVHRALEIMRRAPLAKSA